MVYRNIALTQFIFSEKQKGWNEQWVSIGDSYWTKLVFQGDLLGSIYTNAKDIVEKSNLSSEKQQN